MRKIDGYEWRLRPGDVLRPLYEAFVEEKDRKAFGEFYTPDWLAEFLVAEVLDDDWVRTSIEAVLVADDAGKELEGVGMLDPACGSGTFLYHAARRLLAAPALRGFANADKATVVAQLVNGIDVHPVAAEMARTTLMRALPAEPRNGRAGLRVYEGDSLLVHAMEDLSLLRPRDGALEVVTPKKNRAVIPASFMRRRSFAFDLQRLVATAVEGDELAGHMLLFVPEADRPALQACFDAFKRIVRDEGNSVWCWYIVNTTGPRFLHERKVDRIVANPPWVAMAEVQARGRKRALERFAAEELDLWTGGRDAPHFDIAQLFVRRARDLYLADPARDPAAWVVKKAALRAGGWRRFRDWYHEIGAQSLDLEAIRPFGGGDARRCCVLFDRRPSGLLPNEKAIRAVPVDRRKLPLAHMGAREALGLVEFDPAPAQLKHQASEYLDARQEPAFRQGATITPKVLAVIAEVFPAGPGEDDPTVTTASSDKGKWKSLRPQTGAVPQHWIRPLLTSNQLLPFACMKEAPRAIIPTGDDGSLDDRPGDNRFWARLDRLWNQNRGKGRGTPGTLLQQINYSGKLSAQLGWRGSERTLVLHPASGDIMRGARTQPRHAVLDSTTYYADMPEPEEAAYLVSILNAPTLTRAFAQSRTSGRHFHQNPWRAVPIPRYDGANDLHRRLARLCERAEEIAEDWLRDAPGRHGQVGASKRIRERLTEERVFDRIDELVRKILPDHVDAA